MEPRDSGFGYPGGQPRSVAELLPKEEAGHITHRDDSQIGMALTAALLGEPVLLCGPKGCGKSAAVASWAANNRIPTIRVDCHEEMLAGHLDGAIRMDGHKTWVALGPLVEAAILSQKGKVLLWFEELTALSPGVQKRLNPIMDQRSSVHVAALGKTYAVDRGNLLLVATGNPSSYGGTHPMNEDLISRWQVYDIGWPPEAREMLILLGAWNDGWREAVALELQDTSFEATRYGDAAMERQWRKNYPPFQRVVTGTRTKGTSYALSTRDAAMCVRLWAKLHVKMRGEQDDKSAALAMRGALSGLRGKVADDEEALQRLDQAFKAASLAWSPLP